MSKCPYLVYSSVEIDEEHLSWPQFVRCDSPADITDHIYNPAPKRIFLHRF